jgi:hypothetical protein
MKMKYGASNKRFLQPQKNKELRVSISQQPIQKNELDFFL